jgi:hypothetical protein
VSWIQLAQNRSQWQVMIDIVMALKVPERREFLDQLSDLQPVNKSIKFVSNGYCMNQLVKNANLNLQ